MGKKEMENYIDRVKFGRSYRKYAKDLAKFGDGLVSDLIKVFKESDEDVRRAAASSLGDVGPDARAAVPDLSVALKDEHCEVRKAAVDALRKIGPDAVAAVPALIEVTNKDTDADVRHAADWALMNIRRKE